jgi:hypothetical protein
LRCLYASWSSAPSITVGKGVLAGGSLTVPLTSSPALAGLGAQLTLAAPPTPCAPGCAAATRIFYRRSLTLSARQTVRLPERELELLTLTTPAARRGDYLYSARTVTATLHGVSGSGS